jgi:AraC family transcriptional regulator of adaptative response/methylated-DNA-[protein]-cysteine methyltransferase
MTSNAILTAESLKPMSARQSKPTIQPAEAADDQRWNAVLARDAARDGEFVFAVSSTGVYCRPSCAARRPRRENVQFFVRPEEAEQAGYRACLRCRPKSFSVNTESDGVKAICRFIE